MTAAPDPAATVAVELAQLRGEINTGFESIKGTLGILVERTNRTDAALRQLREDTDADVKQLREDHEKKIAALETKVESLEDRRFPLPVVGALTGVGALLATVIGLLLTR